MCIGGTIWFREFTGGGGTVIFVGGKTGGNDVLPWENVDEYGGKWVVTSIGFVSGTSVGGQPFAETDAGSVFMTFPGVTAVKLKTWLALTVLQSWKLSRVQRVFHGIVVLTVLMNVQTSS